MFSLVDIGLASLMILIAVALSAYQRLHVEKDLATATIRAFVQLMAIGYVLKLVLALDQLPYVLLLLLIMVTSGAWIASSKEKDIPGAFWLSFLGMGLGVALSLGLVLALRLVTVKAQYVIPVASMVIQQGMNAATLTLNRLRGEFESRRGQVEAALALGAPPREAASLPLRTAVRAALIPTINRAKAVGLAALPGSMSGLILYGVDPLQAVRYQAIIEYVVIGSAAITTVAVGLMAYRRFFTQRAQLVSIK